MLHTSVLKPLFLRNTPAQPPFKVDSMHWAVLTSPFVALCLLVTRVTAEIRLGRAAVYSVKCSAFSSRQAVAWVPDRPKAVHLESNLVQEAACTVRLASCRRQTTPDHQCCCGHLLLSSQQQPAMLADTGGMLCGWPIRLVRTS